MSRISPSLNEGRGSHPGDTWVDGQRQVSLRPLNEGRGSHPGDTSPPSAHRAGLSRRSTKAGALTPATHTPRCGARSNRLTAQRRPGLSPRRHAIWLYSILVPATVAQRRPGLSPRRHDRTPTDGGGGPGRSTKAGALTPATLPQRSVILKASIERSTKAGALTPATPSAVT